ncbi:MAG: hypothetical protein ACN6N0_16000, partial [Microvirgula sp.]
AAASTASTIPRLTADGEAMAWTFCCMFSPGMVYGFDIIPALPLPRPLLADDAAIAAGDGSGSTTCLDVGPITGYPRKTASKSAGSVCRQPATALRQGKQSGV